MISIGNKTNWRIAINSVSVGFSLINLPFCVGSVMAQQVIQGPSFSILSLQENLDNLRLTADLVQNIQRHSTSGLTAPSTTVLPTQLSMPVSSPKSTSSSLWTDNRGLWKLEFPSGQVCSVSKIGNDPPSDDCQ